MKNCIKKIIRHPYARDVRNLTLLSVTTIIMMQAITNADLIRLMASNRIYGIQNISAPERTLTLSAKHTTQTPRHDNDQIEKLLASTQTLSRHETTIAPSMEQTLSEKSAKYDFGFNTLPPVNKITIGELGIDAPIVSVFFKDTEDVMVGDFNDELKNGVAVYPGTALPGSEGHSLIFGHSSQERRAKNNYNTIFSMIGDLQEGDTFQVTRNGKLLTYRVIEQTVVSPKNVIDIFNKRNKSSSSHLSLVTCWPRGTDRNRMVVTTELIDSNSHTDNLLTYHN